LRVIVVILVAGKESVVNASATIGAETSFPHVFSLILLNGPTIEVWKISFRPANGTRSKIRWIPWKTIL